MSELQDQIADIRQQSESNGVDVNFHLQWLGLNSVSRNYRAQQIRAFGELVGSIHKSLAGLKILDFGCGDGRWLRSFLEYDAEPDNLVGVDISDVRFELALKKNPLIKLIRIDDIVLPFEDETFDIVTQFVCFSSMASNHMRVSAALETIRILKPGGYMFWWDMTRAVSRADKGTPLMLNGLFSLPIRKIQIGQFPLPSETIRSHKLSFLVRKFIDNKFSYPGTHEAALIGPKP